MLASEMSLLQWGSAHGKDGAHSWAPNPRQGIIHAAPGVEGCTTDSSWSK
jgi:hypothetical protein